MDDTDFLTLNAIRQRREELGMLLSDLASAIGCSPAMLSACEGGFVPKRATQTKIAAALDTTPERLWPEEYV